MVAICIGLIHRFIINIVLQIYRSFRYFKYFFVNEFIYRVERALELDESNAVI